LARQPATDAQHTPAIATPIGAWHAENVRLSLFFADGLPDPRPSWRDLMGIDSETKTVNSADQTEQESGICREIPKSAFTLIFYKSRIDYLLNYRPSDDERTISPSLGDFGDCVIFLKKLALRSSGNKRNLVRLAIGGAIVSPSADNKDAHKRIAGIIDQVNIEGEFEDFLMRINFPRSSSIMPSIRINRLSTWSTVRFGALTAGQPDLPAPTVVSKPFVQCLLDVNTALQSKPLPVGKIPALIDELLETAKTAIRVE
jgi:hypothetical protein